MVRANAIRSPAAAQTELYVFTPNRNRAAVREERFVSRQSSERWTMLCFCLLFLPVFWVLRGGLTSTPPCASRQESALIPPDLCREESASTPPESNWGLFSGLLPPPLGPPPPGPTHCR